MHFILQTENLGTQKVEDPFRVLELAIREPDPWYNSAFTQTKITDVGAILPAHTLTYRKFLCLGAGILAHPDSMSKTLANLLPPFVLFFK